MAKQTHRAGCLLNVKLKVNISELTSCENISARGTAVIKPLASHASVHHHQNAGL